MKKVLLSSVAVLSLAVAGATVYAQNPIVTSTDNDTPFTFKPVTGEVTDKNAPQAQDFVDNSNPAGEDFAKAQDSNPDGPFENNDLGKKTNVDLSESQDLTPKYKGEVGNIETPATRPEFSTHGTVESSDKAVAPMDADAKAKADKAEAKMGEKAADKAAAKTLPNTAVAK